MATLRSSLPSRLRQLLSANGALGPTFKLDSEVLPNIKAFIDKVIQCPLQDIQIPLSGFRWEYSKGNFRHWRPLFLHFDTYFKTYLSCRNDLLLSDKFLEDDSPFPKQAVLQILRVMQTILENCPNKNSFDGLEHFNFLLASTDPEILIAALETLSALVKINPSKLHGSGKLIGCGSVNSNLLSLAQGWGSKEEGLGLYSCVIANETKQDEGLNLFPSDVEIESEKSQHRIGSTLYFELGGDARSTEESSNVNSSSLRVIHIPDIHLRKEDDATLMKQCIKEFRVPSELRFSLLTRIRYACAFRSPRICRLYSRICLLSFIVLVQSSDAHEELVSFFANEPEYTNELIRIVRSEETISGNIRTLAMLALGAQLAAYSSSLERARILSGSSISFSGENCMILLNVLQRAFLSLKTSSEPSSLAFVESLLQFYLLHVVSSSAAGSSVRGSGMVATFLPLLEDTDPTHLHLVCYAVKTLQKLMDYSSSAVSLFKELGGIELLVQRLQTEVHRVVGFANDNLMVIGESSKCCADQLYLQKRLIRVSLKALGSGTYTPGNSSRSQQSNESSLPATLSLIFGKVDKFGGDIYNSAVTIMSEIIHKDPTCFSALHDMGLPDAFLSSVLSGILPSAKAITCVPNGLGAMCLNAKGLEAVKESSALHFLIDIFTSKKYAIAMNDAIVSLANAMEELLRHVPSLRSIGVDIIIEIIGKIASFADSNGTALSDNANGSTSMEMDSEDKENKGSCSLVSAVDSAADGISNERFIQLSIFHFMVLVHKTMENSEACQLFVEKSGIEALLKLLLRSNIVQSSNGMSIAVHSAMVFQGFTQHHTAALARAFCSSLGEHLKKALAELKLVSGTFILDPRMTAEGGISSLLFLVEFLLFIAASKDNRWVTALLTAFGNGGKEILEDVGRLHRVVLWEISCLEDVKPKREDNTAGHASESQQAEMNISEPEEQRYNSFRQFIDPLQRRRTPGWSIESQFFDLISLYRDLGRATSSQQRSNANGSSNMQFGAAHQSHHSGSSSAGAHNGKEFDKQRSYYNSSCNMVRSLSFHITNLFQELGKVMLLSSRRRDDIVNLSPSSKAVASTFAKIALDHMNFGGHVIASGSEASISTKCRYFGKVIDFIDGSLLERPDSCNPVLLNCLYGHGVVQLVLTTFEATSQLLFTVNKPPASPMETDDGGLKQDENKEVDSWIYGPLASYGKLMDHLVTSSLILSPFTKHLLIQPNGDIPFPRDADTFVKVLQSMVLKTVIPVWTHPQFVDCGLDFITAVISIIRHVYSGVEVKNTNSSNSSRITGPPPNETTISTIVEMGFSRSRAEEALRQVGSISVELAMEWLFSHPEEAQEDDELARALAMSLGNSESHDKEAGASENAHHIEEQMVQLPLVEELLSTCTKLLQMKEPLAFPIRDLLVMLCSQNDGQYRSNIISFIVDCVKDCSKISDCANSIILSALFHVLALIFQEDVVAREIASKNGLVKVSTNLLSLWESDLSNSEKFQVPKWITTAFLAMDRLLQADQKLNPEIAEQKKEVISSQQTSISIDEHKQNKLQSAFGLSFKHVEVKEQKRLIEITCSCIKRQLPSEAMHAVLQLCSTLTKNHAIAASFHDFGGLSLLLSLPITCLFPGFDNIAATIIRHVLEDPQTLQQAMEFEIRHSLVAAANRHSNGRVSPRNFISSLSSAISRDPVIFMQAAQSVCQVEMVGERPYIVLLKERDKDKSKEKEKEKTMDKDKPLTSGTGHGKFHDSNLNLKSVKAHRKYPQTFVAVIELLLEYVCAYVPPLKDDMLSDASVRNPSIADMDIDVSAIKGKGKAIASASNDNETSSQEASASLAKVVFILKLLTEILMMYASSAHVLLRRDAEVSSSRGSHQKGQTCTGGIFHHVLFTFLPYSRNLKKEKVDGDWRPKLASRASQFLVASCVRSSEARKRVFTEINYIFNDFVGSCNSFRPPNNKIQAFIDLLNDALAARTPTGSYALAEGSLTFIDVGLVGSLARTLRVLDLDHSDSSKVVTGLIKALELVTKEHVQAAESNSGKGDISTKPSDHDQPGQAADNLGDTSQSMDAVSQSHHDSIPHEHMEQYGTMQSFGGSEAVMDDMEHDRDLSGAFAPVAEDDYMHETSEDTRGLENGIDSMGIQFEIQSHGQQNLDEDEDDDEDDEDDDEDMSGDDGEEVDEDEHNDLEDEVHHLPHPGADHEDHEIDDDEFEEEVLEDDDEDDDDDEDGVILRLEEGINGINVFDHIEVLGRDPNDALHVMPVEVFGSRRQGRTTSIYSLLGRTSDNSASSRHPLLIGTSLHQTSARQPDNAREMHLPDRNSESAFSRMDTIFRSLRNGRHGHRLNLWMDDNQQGVSNTGIVLQSLEELLVSQLRRPALDKTSDQNTVVEHQSKGEAVHSQELESGLRPETSVVNNVNIESGNVALPTVAIDASENIDLSHSSVPQQVADTCNTQPVEMQYEHDNVPVRDVEAISQESGGSGATLGGEIGSAGGHDEGAERQGSTYRILTSEMQSAHTRRTNLPLGNSSTVGTRDISLHSVTDVSENSNRETEQDGPAEQRIDSNAGSAAIDPAFLDALPEELRAEVLSAQQGQVSPLTNAEPQNAGDIDPEFIAALPPDIRAEVLAQQQAQRMHQSQELEGQPVEMDTVSIIATFPSELREEVLLTSSDAILANLTPALVAEASMLRDRFAHRYNRRTLFGMYPRNRRGETARRGEGVRASLERIGGIVTRRSGGVKVVEADGTPLVDTEALHAFIRLLRIVQPLYKGQLQRLLLNLCTHSETRTSLVKILMDMLILDTRKHGNQLSACEPSYRLYACQTNVMYSRPQFFDGVPPLVSRRVLETLTYLARNHPYVAKTLLQFRLPLPAPQEAKKTTDLMRGKAVMIVDENGQDVSDIPQGYIPIALLLRLLNQPLYLRSITHLEQLLNLLEVIIDSAQSKSSSVEKLGISVSEQPSGPQKEDAVMNTESGGISSVGSSSKVVDSSQPSTSVVDNECDPKTVLLNLPQTELKLLCSLLAREGLSDNAYALAAEVMKKLVAITPTHCNLFITELASAVQNLTKSAMDELRMFGEAVRTLLSTTSSDGASILRVLQALSSFVTLLSEKEKNLQELAEKERTSSISQIRDINAVFEPLWLELSACISKIETYFDSAPDLLTAYETSTPKPSGTPLPAGSQNVLPPYLFLFPSLQPPPQALLSFYHLHCTKMSGLSFRSLTFMFIIAFIVWSANFESCIARRNRHWRENRVASASLQKKKGKNHSGSSSGQYHHSGSAPKAKAPSHNKVKPPPLPPQNPYPKENTPTIPPQKGQTTGNSVTFNVLDFGAKGDGNTDDTKAFQVAWAAACKVEASTIIIPSRSQFLVGPISFSGPYCAANIVFQLDGTIIAPTDSKAWGKGLLQWLEFTKLKGITVQGKGIIDGRGSVWWQQVSPFDDPIDDDLKLILPLNSTVQQKPSMPIKGKLSGKMPMIKPTALRFYGSFNVTVTGITIQNSPECHLKFDNCVGVLVHDMSVSSPGDSPNTDGIHLQNSKDVLIHSNTLACGDDCISIQTGCSNVYIHNVNCGPGHGISIGSLGRYNTKACVSNITVRDVTLHNTMTGIRIKTWQGGSGSVQGVLFSNIQVSEVQLPIVIDQFYCDKSKCNNQTSAVALSGINYERIRGTYTVKPVHFACSDSLPCQDVTLTAIQLKPQQEQYHMYDPFCWQTFGELRTPTVPPINCLQIGKPSRNRVQSDGDLC